MCLIHFLFLYWENRVNVFEGFLESNMFSCSSIWLKFNSRRMPNSTSPTKQSISMRPISLQPLRHPLQTPIYFHVFSTLTPKPSMPPAFDKHVPK